MSDEHRPLLITGGRIVDGLGGPPLVGGELLVEDGRIAAVGPRGAVTASLEGRGDRGGDRPGDPAPPGAPGPDPSRVRVVDVGGRTVLPGFFDTHVHLTTAPASPDADPLAALGEPASRRWLGTVPRMRATLDAGVTTVRDLSGADAGVRAAVADGTVAGPSLLVALRILSITGGHGDWRSLTGTDLTGGSGGGAVADSPDGFTLLVREALREGADWIKVAASGGMGSPRSDPDHGGLTEADLVAVVTEAARHGGVGVAAHAQGTASIATAVRAGVRSVEHGYGIDDATVALMGERGTFLVPTLSTLCRPLVAAGAPWVLEKRRRWVERGRERLHAALTAGLEVVLGTDAGIVPHGTNLTELALLVEHGLSPSEAVVAGTSRAARMCGLDDEVGSLRAGLRADVVVVDADPLTDPAALADPDRVQLVLQRGAVVKHTLPEEQRP